MKLSQTAHRRTWRTAAMFFALLLSVAAFSGISFASSTQGPKRPEYLPYGVPIPQAQELTAVPEPYDWAKHGPAQPNTQPQANVVGRPGTNLPKHAPKTKIPNVSPGTGDRGFNINSGQGVYAANDAQTDLSIPNNAVGTTIYAPTHMPAGGSCLETVTAHWRYSGMSSTAHAHGFWDWCAIDGSTSWQLLEFMDSTWKSKYVRIYDGEDRYFTEAFKDGAGCWHGVLYNFNLGRWEEKVTPAICGSSTFTSGWTMWESHYLMERARVCPAFPSIRASVIQIYSGSAWSLLSTANSSPLGPSGLCWTNGTYTFHVHQANYDWHAHTP